MFIGTHCTYYIQYTVRRVIRISFRGGQIIRAKRENKLLIPLRMFMLYVLNVKLISREAQTPSLSVHSPSPMYVI